MMESLYELIARVLDVDVNKIKEDSSPENISSWDSFNALMMVSELENNFNVKFTMDEIMSVKNVKDIKKALIKHGVKAGLE